MAIIVEDGSTVANSNSYVSTATLDAYATARGVTIPSADQEMYLILAMDYLEQVNYIGRKQLSTQSLQWPRYQVWIDTYPLAANTIPRELINAECEVALSIYNDNDPLQDRPRSVSSEKVGQIEVHYQTGTSSIVLPVKINYMLQKLIAGGSNGITVSKG